MTTPADIVAASHGPLEGREPRQLIMMFHGPDAVPEQMMDLASLFAPHFPEARFLAPEAPYRHPAQPERRIWLSGHDGTPDSEVAALRDVAPLINGYLDRALEENGLADGDVLLVGFSEGAVAALGAGLRRANPVAGILCFSGGLVGRPHLKSETVSRPPVYLIQGEDDPYLSGQDLLNTIEALMQAGVHVDSHVVRGVGHGLGRENLSYGARFIMHAFGMTHDPANDPHPHGVRALNRLIHSVLKSGR